MNDEVSTRGIPGSPSDPDEDHYLYLAVAAAAEGDDTIFESVDIKYFISTARDSPLAKAIETNHVMFISKILKIANQEKYDFKHFTNLFFICLDFDRDNILSYLMSFDADPFFVDENKRTFVHKILEQKKTKLFRKIWNKFTDDEKSHITKIYDGENKTLIHLALENGKLEVINLILHDSIELIVNYKGESLSPFENMCFKGTDLADLPNLVLNSLNSKNIDVEGLLFRKNPELNLYPIHLMIQGNNLALLKVVLNSLLYHKEERFLSILTLSDNNGITPLHMAAYADNGALPIIIDALTISDRKYNSNNLRNFINMRDKTGCTPLHWAVVKKSEKNITLLTHFGADHKAKDDHNNTPQKLINDKRIGKIYRSATIKHRWQHILPPGILFMLIHILFIIIVPILYWFSIGRFMHIAWTIVLLLSVANCIIDILLIYHSDPGIIDEEKLKRGDPKVRPAEMLSSPLVIQRQMV